MQSRRPSFVGRYPNLPSASVHGTRSRFSILSAPLCTKKFGQTDAQEILREFLKDFTIPATGSAEARNPLSYLDGDYEDAMQIAAAVAGGADWLLTRDQAGFSKSPVPITTPDQFLSKFGIRKPIAFQ